MSSVIRKVALVGGSGRLGPYLLKALHSDPAFDVTVITRTNSTATFPEGTKLIKVADGYPDDEIVKAFKGQDAVILSLGYQGGQHHAALAEASKKAGVKRLITGWGGNVANQEAMEIFPIGKKVAEDIKALEAMESPEWSWTAICCGLFFDFCLEVGFFGIDALTKTATIWDDGEQKFSVTARPTIGLAVTKVLAHPKETANRRVYISSFQCSLNEILDGYKTITSSEGWNITKVTSEEMVANATENVKKGENVMYSIGRLGLATAVKPGLQADFAAEGILDNQMLGLETNESSHEIIAKVLKA